MKKVILLGGGFDSTTLMKQQVVRGHQLYALFVDYGQKAVFGEYTSAKYFCKKYRVPFKKISVPLGTLGNSAILKNNPTNYSNRGSRDFFELAEGNCLEFRNGVFLSLAMMYACSILAERILLGFYKEPLNEKGEYAYPDAAPNFAEVFVNATKQAIRKPTRDLLEVDLPFKYLKRWEILRLAMTLDEEILEKAFTCYESESLTPCGECGHCQEFKENKKRIQEEMAK